MPENLLFDQKVGEGSGKERNCQNDSGIENEFFSSSFCAV